MSGAKSCCGAPGFTVLGETPFGLIGTHWWCLEPKGHDGPHAPLPHIQATRGGIRYKLEAAG